MKVLAASALLALSTPAAPTVEPTPIGYAPIATPHDLVALVVEPPRPAAPVPVVPRASRKATRPRSAQVPGAVATSPVSVVASGWSTAGASWYGPGLYGNGTACGQRYDARIVGVAHRSLPCGTVVTFEYGGRVVSAPVIDRGPFVGGRMWDLSAGLCRALAHCFTGPVNYRVG